VRSSFFGEESRLGLDRSRYGDSVRWASLEDGRRSPVVRERKENEWILEREGQEVLTERKYFH
jgi:hypothetical protein